MSGGEKANLVVYKVVRVDAQTGRTLIISGRKVSSREDSGKIYYNRTVAKKAAHEGNLILDRNARFEGTAPNTGKHRWHVVSYELKPIEEDYDYFA